MPVAARELERLAKELAKAVEGLDTEEAISEAMDRAAERFDRERFAQIIAESIMRGAMLGAVDSLVEREQDEDEPLAQFVAYRPILMEAGRRFTRLPFQEAMDQFRARDIVSRDVYDALSDAALRKAFTVAGLASEELLGDAHAELQRQLDDSRNHTFKDEATGKWVYKGPNLREFNKFVSKRLESAGWTPANPSHVETIYRTNVRSAYSSGRLAEMTQPSVLAARPYWQILTVRDSRQRPTHRKAHGVVLPADHPFWRVTGVPPWGYNCRCKWVSRSKRWVDRHGGVSAPPRGLPDPGFTSAGATLVPPEQLEQLHEQDQRRAEPVPEPRPTPQPQPRQPRRVDDTRPVDEERRQRDEQRRASERQQQVERDRQKRQEQRLRQEERERARLEKQRQRDEARRKEAERRAALEAERLRKLAEKKAAAEKAEQARKAKELARQQRELEQAAKRARAAEKVAEVPKAKTAAEYFEGEYKAKYGEAGRSVAHGREMAERGLAREWRAVSRELDDVPIDATQRTKMKVIVAQYGRDTGGKTLGEIVERLEGAGRIEEARRVRGISALVEHRQSIAGSGDIAIAGDLTAIPGTEEAATQAMRAVNSFYRTMSNEGVVDMRKYRVHYDPDVRPKCSRPFRDEPGLVLVDGAENGVHELGHAIEQAHQEAYRRAREFLQRRTAGEAPQQLSKVMDDDGYGAYELTREDKFAHPYIGKDYLADTEVTSMGVELLYRDAISFARLDLDHFLFTLGQLAGKVVP